VPLVMTIKHGNHCFRTSDSGAGNGFIIEIPPKGRHKFGFWHAGDWRGCASVAGRFELTFSPSPKVGEVPKDKIGFWFDRGTKLGILYKDYPNYFPGKLTQAGKEYTFTTGANLGSPIVAGKAIGDWVAVRTGGTAKGVLTMSKSFNVGGSNEKALSAEVRNSISATVESGVTFGPATVGVSVTGSHESSSTEASTIAKTFDNGGEVSCEQEIDTEKYDYEVVWQWQVSVSGSSPATIATCSVGCTKTGAKPTFAPGSPQHLQSCKIKREAQPVAAPPRTQSRPISTTTSNFTAKAMSQFARGLLPENPEAVCEGHAEQFLFFQGQNVWVYNNKSGQVSGPVPSASASLPSNIDAAVNGYNGKLYFFKGAQYWRYDIAADKMDAGYPSTIAAGWPGLPNRVTSALRAGNNKLLFLSGDAIYVWDMSTDTIIPRVSSVQRDLPGLPASIDAATLINGKTLFFGNSQLFNPKTN